MNLARKIIPLIAVFISIGWAQIVEAQDEPLNTVSEAVPADAIEGQLEGTVEFDQACVAEIMAADMEFAQAYAEFMACQGDPKKVPVLILYRTHCSETCTLGEIWCDGEKVCSTLERPVGTNRPNKDCIPYGEYECTSYSGTKFKDVFIVNNVPGRSAILFHGGTNAAHTRGCFIVGTYVNVKNECIEGADKALEKLRKYRKCGFRLVIKEGPAPTPTPTPTPTPKPKPKKKRIPRK